MPERCAGARSAARQEDHARLEASVPGVTAADDDSGDPHAVWLKACAAPFDGEDDIGQEFQSEREIEYRTVMLEPPTAALPDKTVSTKTHRGILPAECGSRDMHGNDERKQSTDRSADVKRTCLWVVAQFEKMKVI